MAQATKEGVPPYAIAHNAWLKQIVRICPHTLADLGHIEGLGDRRIEKYGEQILAVLGNFHN
jgi:ATP-dependent DNA helicase RecQ